MTDREEDRIKLLVKVRQAAAKHGMTVEQWSERLTALAFFRGGKLVGTYLPLAHRTVLVPSNAGVDCESWREALDAVAEAEGKP